MQRLLYNEHRALRPPVVFAVCFLLLWALYGVTLHAGWAYDAIDWLGVVRTTSFSEHLNFGHHNGLSHYQLTQLVIWSIYQVFGDWDPAYFVIHVALQALNASLIYAIVRRLMVQAGSRTAQVCALAAAAFFCFSPSAGEVIVYKAAFHYGFANALSLGTCSLCLSYLITPKPVMAWLAGFLYAASLFSLELSYLTPVYCLALILWYTALNETKPKQRRAALRCFSLPQALMAGGLFVVNIASHGGSGLSLFSRPLPFFLIKPPLFLLHLLNGRFLPQPLRNGWKELFCTAPAAAVFYLTSLAALILLLLKFRNLAANGKLMLLGLIWMLPAAGLCALMWFPENGYIYCDRYLYPLLPAASIVLGALFMSIRVRPLRYLLAGLFLLSSLAGTLYNNYLWAESSRITTVLLRQVPLPGCNNRALLLNCPFSFRGAPMIMPGAVAGFSAIDAQRFGQRLKYPVTEVMAFDMQHPGDGASVRILSDSMLLVTLNQPGAWMRDYDTARSYETPLYRVRLLDATAYELTLRDRNLCLWFQSDGRLQQVVMANAYQNVLTPKQSDREPRLVRDDDL